MTCAALDYQSRDSILELFRNKVAADLRDQLITNLERFQSDYSVHQGPPKPQYTFGDQDRPEPSSAEEYIDWIIRQVLPQSANLSSPLCMGHMSGPIPAFVPVLSELVVSLNQNLVKREASPSLTALERRTIAVLHRLVFQEDDTFYRRHASELESTLGLLSGGGTMANLTALWIARNSCFPPSGDFPGVEQAGICASLDRYGYDGAVIVGSELMHYSIGKAASILGLGSNELLTVPVDRENRLDIEALQDCLSDCAARRRRVLAIVGTAGSTDCGSIDPLDRIGPLARSASAFFHVDAAWGGPLLFSGTNRQRLSGIEGADSVAFDTHKQMYLPVASSVLLLKNPSVAKLIERCSHYMLRDGSGDLGRRSLEGSRNGAVLFLDAALAIIGVRGYEFLIDENLRKARLMAGLIRARGDFELLFDPAMNVILYRHIPELFRRCDLGCLSAEDNRSLNAFNEELHEAQFAAGRTYVSRTTVENTIHGRRMPIVALRAVVANPLIEEHHMRAVLEDQALIGSRLAESWPVSSASG